MKRSAAHAVTFILNPISKETPIRNSAVLRRIDSTNEAWLNQARWNTSKYSVNLMAEPIGSTPFTNPEKMKTIPIKILAIILVYFILIYV